MAVDRLIRDDEVHTIALASITYVLADPGDGTVLTAGTASGSAELKGKLGATMSVKVGHPGAG